MSTTRIIVANIISIIAQLFLLIASSRKNKNEMLIYQIVFMVIACISALVLKGYSVIAVNAVAIVRNILVIKDKNSPKVNIVLIIISIVLNIFLNNNGFLGYLLVLVSSAETISITNPDSSVILIKLIAGISSVCWFIFMLAIQNYVDSICNLVAACSFFLFVVKEIRNNKQKELGC